MAELDVLFAVYFLKAQGAEFFNKVVCVHRLNIHTIHTLSIGKGMNNLIKHHIHLHGKLAEFGESFELAVTTPFEAVRALATQLNGFADTLANGEY